MIDQLDDIENEEAERWEIALQVREYQRIAVIALLDMDALI